jgi:hypothetical protein
VQPAKVATPAIAGTGLAAQASVPVPVAIASVTALVLVVTTSPLESATLTTGWVVNADPPVELDGSVVKTSSDAVPATVKLVDVDVVSPDDVADRVKAPWVPRVILQPAKVATPETALTGSVVQASVPVPVAMARVTGAVLVGTTFPAASSIEATG